jgi:DNA helicase-2/ATP-dependent DNA helicase PcrA
LALEHKLAAKRGNFFDAYFAMDLLDEDAAAPKSNGEHTGPAMVRPLLGSILDLASCFEPGGGFDEFSAMDVLRGSKALVHVPEGVEDRRTQLEKLHGAVMSFGDVIRSPGATVR